MLQSTHTSFVGSRIVSGCVKACERPAERLRELVPADPPPSLSRVAGSRFERRAQRLANLVSRASPPAAGNRLEIAARRGGILADDPDRYVPASVVRA